MKFSQVFGDASALRIKTFVLAGHNFKVRVPVQKELDEMAQRIEVIDQAKFQARFEKATQGMELIDGDAMIDGRSTKELVETAMKVENRILEMFRFLVPAEGQTNDLTYEDIEAELPFSVQLEMIKAIQEAIQPNFGDSRKNS